MVEPNQTIRLASWNMQAGVHSTGYRDYALKAHQNLWASQAKQTRLQQAALQLESFDVVALQECDIGSLRSGFVHQGHLLATAAGFEHHAFHTARRVAGLASSALAVLSRFPIVSSQAFRLPSKIPGRGALEVVVDHPTGRFRLLVVHLSLSKKARAEQLLWIQRWSEDEGLPSVVLGDFNAVSSCQDLGLFSARFESEAWAPGHVSFPSWNPTKALDHILVKGLKGSRITSHRLECSDHLAVARNIWFSADDCSKRRGHARGKASG